MSATAARSVAPSAFGDDAQRFVNLTVTLATTDWKLRFFGSVLGYLWSLIRPLLLFAVLYVVFTKIFHAGSGIPHYAVYLLTAIMLWTFFTETTGASVECMVLREALLRKMRFPRLVIPLSVALTAMFNLAANFVVVLVFAIATGVKPQVGWLELPLLVLLLTLLAVGLGMFLSVLYVRFRDLKPIWEVVTQVLFYASPIIYTAAKYRSVGNNTIQHLAMVNPIASILTQMNRAFVNGNAAGAASAIGGGVRLLIPLALIVGLFASGLWFFSREAPRIAENL